MERERKIGNRMERRRTQGGKSIERRGSRTRRFENEGAKVSAIKLCLYEVGTGSAGRRTSWPRQRYQKQPYPRPKSENADLSRLHAVKTTIRLSWLIPLRASQLFVVIKSPSINFSFSSVFSHFIFYLSSSFSSYASL